MYQISSKKSIYVNFLFVTTDILENDFIFLQKRSIIIKSRKKENNMNTIIGELGKSAKFIDLNNQIQAKKSPIQISGLTDVGMLQLISAINEFDKKPICIITYNEIQAKKIYEDIKYYQDKVVLFPKKEIVTYDYIAESKDLPYERIESLNKIVQKKNIIIVTTIEAIMQNIPSKETLYQNQIELKIGGTYNLEEIKQKLIKLRLLKI